MCTEMTIFYDSSLFDCSFVCVCVFFFSYSGIQYPNVIGPIMDSIESVVMRGESVLEDLNDTSSTTTDRTKQEGPLEMYTSLQVSIDS